MSTNAELDRIVTLEQAAPVVTLVAPEALPPYAPPQPYTAPEPPAALPDVVAVPERTARTRPLWVVPAAIAAAGLIASGTLDYFFYTTTGKLDATRHQLAVTQASLDSTKQSLTSLQADARAKQITADYVSLYIADEGKVRVDYQSVVACHSYSQCRTAAQQALADVQKFQTDRQAASVPAALNSSDGQLGDSLSAAIAALQELIDGMDNGNTTRIDDGFNKLDDAMLNLAKAESALGAEIR